MSTDKRFTREQIETRLGVATQMREKAFREDPKSVPFFTELIDKLVMMEAVDECETCCGSGRVIVRAQHRVDAGTKWQRTAEEQIADECPECHGTGTL